MHIDWWTLALQAFNFLVLLWLLTRFFYRPVTAIMAERQRAAQKLLDDAATALGDAEEARNELATMRADAAAERNRIVTAAQTKAEDVRKDMLAQAGTEAAKIRHEAEADLVRAEAVRDRALATRAEELAVAIAQRLLHRLPADAAVASFVDGFCAAIEQMPVATVEALKGADDIAILSAAALDPDMQARIVAALRERLGREVPLAFHVDPEVLAGLELRSADIALCNSWREDIAHIRQEFARDDT